MGRRTREANHAFGLGLDLGLSGANRIPLTLPRFRAALAGVRAGTGYARIACFGDSTTAGLYAGGGIKGRTNARQFAWPKLYAGLLTTAGIPAICENVWGTSHLVPGDGYEDYNAKVVLGAGWGPTADATTSLGGQRWLNTTTTNPLTYTTLAAVDSFDIWYPQSATGGTLSWAVDGGAATNFSSAGADGFVKLSVTGLTKAIHAIEIRRVSGTCGFVGIEAWDSTVKSVRVQNMGWAGSTTTDWNVSALPHRPLPAMTIYAPDLIVVMMGINDYTDGIGSSVFRTNLQAFWDTWSPVSDIVFVTPFPSNPASTAEATQLSYMAKVLDAAQENNAPYFNMRGTFTDWTTANANAYAYDDRHPNLLGTTAMAQRIMSALA